MLRQWEAGRQKIKSHCMCSQQEPASSKHCWSNCRNSLDLSVPSLLVLNYQGWEDTFSYDVIHIAIRLQFHD